MKKKFGFTLAELLMTLSTIAIIAAVAIPTLLNNARPNEEQIKLKKAYMNLSMNVKALIQDEDEYPNGAKVGFADTSFPASKYNDSNWNLANYENAESTDKARKFCRLMAERMNAADDSGCVPQVLAEGEEARPSFTTPDGVAWYMPITTFSGNDAQEITIDVDGTRGDNCEPTNNACNKPDRFKINMTKNGYLYVAANDTVTEYYLTHDDTNKSYAAVQKAICAAKSNPKISAAIPEQTDPAVSEYPQTDPSASSYTSPSGSYENLYPNSTPDPSQQVEQEPTPYYGQTSSTPPCEPQGTTEPLNNGTYGTAEPNIEPYGTVSPYYTGEYHY